MMVRKESLTPMYQIEWPRVPSENVEMVAECKGVVNTYNPAVV